MPRPLNNSLNNIRIHHHTALPLNPHKHLTYSVRTELRTFFCVQDILKTLIESEAYFICGFSQLPVPYERLGWRSQYSLLKCYFPHWSGETRRNANLSPETGPWIWNRKGFCQQILKELLEIIWNYLMSSQYDVSQSKRNQIKLKQDPIA